MFKRSSVAALSVGFALLAGLATSRADLTPPKSKDPASFGVFELSPALTPSTAVTIHVELAIDEVGKVTAVNVRSVDPETTSETLVQHVRERLLATTFHPAKKDGVAIKSKLVHVVRLAPAPASSASSSVVVPPIPAPSVSVSASTPTPSSSASAATPEPPPIAAEPSIEIRVPGKRLPPTRGPGDVRVDSDILTIAPHASGGDMLVTAPGVWVGHVEGDAVANQIFLRGFNADHGQDIELKVGLFPINVPSHIHGQGYADLNFLIPEVVRSLRVIEGVYDPRQGDFAVAGSAYFDLGVAERGYRVKASVGSFGATRLVGVWAPRDESESTFGAVSLKKTNGFGPNNRGSSSASALAQYLFELPAGYTLTLSAGAYGARANIAGALRQDDINAGRVGFFDSYASPSANAQSAFAARTMLGLEIDRVTEDGAHLEFDSWAMVTTFRERLNFTGFTQRSQIDPRLVGFGDLIEQSNQETALGASARYRTKRIPLFKWLSVFAEPGLSFRTGSTEQSQNLLKPPENQTWDRRVDAAIRGTDVGMYLDLDFRIFKRVCLRGGLRADVLAYDIDDRLGNYTPIFQKKTYEPGLRRTALGVAYGPRATLEWEPTAGIKPMLAYGEGYRSPQARLLAEGEQAPYTKVRSLEAGLRLSTRDQKITFTTSIYQTKLSDDLVFDAEQARLERVGPTTRRGVSGYFVARPWEFLIGTLSATYTHATLDSPPTGKPEDPSPPFREGQLLPFVPKLVVRSDVAVLGRLATLHEVDLKGRFGVGFSYLGTRPLPYAQEAAPFSLFDVSGGLTYREFELSLDVSNLFDKRYYDTELVFPSSWGTNGLPSSLPAKHGIAGAPRVAFVSLAVTL